MGIPKSVRPEAVEVYIPSSAEEKGGLWFGISKGRKAIQGKWKANVCWATFNTGDTVRTLIKWALHLGSSLSQFRL